MSEFSPATQAVDDAFWKIINDKWNIYDRRRAQIAAALRAAVDQVVPDEPLYGGDQRWMFERDARQACRKKLLAIADELEAQ
jgi:hypothetical protein